MRVKPLVRAFLQIRTEVTFYFYLTRGGRVCFWLSTEWNVRTRPNLACVRSVLATDPKVILARFVLFIIWPKKKLSRFGFPPRSTFSI